MTEIKVQVSQERKTGTSQKTGKPYDINVVVLTLPNGGQVEVISNRFNYRTFDYLIDLIKGGA